MKFVIYVNLKLDQKCGHASRDIGAVSFVLIQHYPEIFNAIRAFQQNNAINNRVLPTFENDKICKNKLAIRYALLNNAENNFITKSTR